MAKMVFTLKFWYNVELPFVPIHMTIVYFLLGMLVHNGRCLIRFWTRMLVEYYYTLQCLLNCHWCLQILCNVTLVCYIANKYDCIPRTGD